MASGSGLEVLGVSKAFGERVVLADVDLAVAEGTTVALLGRSGCGKTTLLRIVAGLETPDSGTVTVGKRTLAGPRLHVPAEKRRVGMVFQDWALFPHLTVAKNVAFGLPRTVRHGSRVHETLEMVGLGGFGDRMPMTLSGGEQQRVAIARAVAPQPDVLLLDEPFSNLDADLRVQVRSDIHRLLRGLGITAAFVTHDQEEAFVIGDQVAVMQDGRIVQQDTPAQLYAQPVSGWVAGFVGAANLLPGTAAGDRADTSIGAVPLASRAFGERRVLVRPEALVLSAGGDAQVEDVEFYGHDTAYRVRVAGGDVVVRSAAAPRFRPGDRVSLAYAGAATVSFPVDPPDAADPVDAAGAEAGAVAQRA